MTPLSRGAVRVSGADANALPQIDVGYLTDAEGRDVKVLESGLEIARDLANQAPLRDWIGEELS